jgi:hypothetical protein
VRVHGFAGWRIIARMGAPERFERYARRLASGGAGDIPSGGSLERAAVRLAGGRLTRRQAIGAAAAGSLALAAGMPPRARGQGAQCPPPSFPDETKVCNYTCPGFAPSWICCRQEQVCCTEQPQINGQGGCAVNCCELGQTCCYVASLGGWGCCGCPIGLHHCSREPIGQCCQRDEVCDTVDFVCRPGDECPHVVCAGACCEAGEVCAGGSCCQAAKGCGGGGVCCGRGEICDGNTCKQLVDYKRPPRQRETKNDKVDTPPLQTFDADLAADADFRSSVGARGSANASARGYLVGRKHGVRLPAHTRRRISVKLTRRARRHLNRGKPLSAELTLTFRDPAGRRISERHRLTILPKRRG